MDDFTPHAAAHQVIHGEPRDVFVRLRRRVAYTHTSPTPIVARELNRLSVTAALEAAGIGHFAVPGNGDLSSVVAVDEDDRARVAAALAASLRGTPGYLSTPPRSSGGAERLVYSSGDAGLDVLREAGAVRVSRFLIAEGTDYVLGHEHGCVVEFWRRHGGALVAPRPNRMTSRVPVDAPVIAVPQYRFTRLLSRYAPVPDGIAASVRSLEVFDHLGPDDIDFPIDAVYTWVDGSDPAWARRKAAAQGAVYHEESASDARFLSRDELRYSLRSLHLNAPWIRNVHIVTDAQTPAWLDTTQSRVRVVDHRTIFSRAADLPTFNSHSIESQLHHIPDLAEHFLYFNDDMFIGRPVAPQKFFTAAGMTRYFPSASRIPLGPIVADDTPVDAACKNNRALLEETFGKVISQPMDHIPYALRRSVMAELEATYTAAYERTAASRFRSMEDLSVTSSLAHYYAMLTGRALPGGLRYGYVQLAHPELVSRLDHMLRHRDRDAFCLNDAFSTPEDIEAQNAVLGPFLDSYFPLCGPAEVPSVP